MSFFISFEGIDGCGKTTQLQLLCEHLTSIGHTVTMTREPGGTALAEAIRNYLLHSPQPLGSRTELLLFGAARAQHVDELIRPALARGEVVLSDRFADSSVAYQGGGLGLPPDFVRRMNAFATDGLQPHMTFLLDVDPAIGQQRRLRGKEDRIEGRGLEFQERVRAAYLAMAQAEPQRIVVIDAMPAPDEIHKRILQVLQESGLLKANDDDKAIGDSNLKLIKGGLSKGEKPATLSANPVSKAYVQGVAQSLEAEQVILGSLLFEHHVAHFINLLEANDFYRELHQKIFKAVTLLHDDSKPVNLITTVEFLRQKGQLQEVGGAAYLAALVEVYQSSASPSDVENYIQQLKELSDLRRQIQTNSDEV